MQKQFEKSEDAIRAHAAFCLPLEIMVIAGQMTKPEFSEKERIGTYTIGVGIFFAQGGVQRYIHNRK